MNREPVVRRRGGEEVADDRGASAKKNVGPLEGRVLFARFLTRGEGGDEVAGLVVLDDRRRAGGDEVEQDIWVGEDVRGADAGKADEAGEFAVAADGGDRAADEAGFEARGFLLGREALANCPGLALQKGALCQGAFSRIRRTLCSLAGPAARNVTSRKPKCR